MFATFFLDSGCGSMRNDKGHGKGEVDKREAKGKPQGATGQEPGDIGSACISLQTPRESVLAFRLFFCFDRSALLRNTDFQ